MAVIRRKTFGLSNRFSSSDVNLLDNPEKLLRYAFRRGVTLVPLDVAQLAKELGIAVQYCDLRDDLSGILQKSSDDSWTLSVNSKHHTNRQRYTIAHELAHFCLHRQFKDRFEDQIFFRGADTSKEELQANEFAGAILMPEEEIRKRVREGIRDVGKLADLFAVSTLALRIRAKNIGMTGHGL